ncbi:hypothetical protein [Burkholderia vietnamiensis]|uniref:hypothetical protein n=1 Tax=Burkholderia vietnamiensis TaxID=60552 RepID=UPI00264BD913|nr:hypothetical protein [Burkholderia vietnamiensis]MDN7669820.1 hypothetical protein [Burkholderia vietnamiensis]
MDAWRRWSSSGRNSRRGDGRVRRLAWPGVDGSLAMPHGRVSSVACRSGRDISVKGYWFVRRAEPDDARVARFCSRRGAGEAAIGLALGLYSEQAFSAVFGATLRQWLRTQRGDDANARDRRGEDVGERVGRWRRGRPETQPASTNEKGASGFPEAPFLHPW